MNRPLQICMIGSGFHRPWIEGCASVAYNLAYALRRQASVSLISLVRADYFGFAKDGHEQNFQSIVYLNPLRVFGSARHRGEYCLTEKMLDAARIGSALKLLDSKHGIDIVHVHNVSHLMISMLAKMLFKKSIVAHVYCVSYSPGDILARDFIDGYICTSKSSFSYLTDKGLTKEKVHVVPPIIDCNIYRPLNDVVVETRPNSQKSSFIVTYAGNIFPERFPPELLREIEKIADMGRNLELRIYTPDTTWNRSIALRLKRSLSRFNIRSHLAITNLSENEKVRVYNASDVLIFPFRQMKRFSIVDPPLTVLESMASGRIAIASRVLSIPEVISHGKNGFLVNPEDYEELAMTLKHVMDHFQELRYIESNARETIEMHYSPELVSNRVMNIYKSALR